MPRFLQLPQKAVKSITAPGRSKIATDYSNQDYTAWFNGTSAATPHVAGVAALTLSVNSSLTQKQVADIVEQTAQKQGAIFMLQQ